MGALYTILATFFTQALASLTKFLSTRVLVVTALIALYATLISLISGLWLSISQPGAESSFFVNILWNIGLIVPNNFSACASAIILAYIYRFGFNYVKFLTIQFK